MPHSDQLPELLSLGALGGDYQAYEDALYDFYLRDIVRGGLVYRGGAVRVRRTPEFKGKGAGFWHLTTEGPVEAQRLLDLRRCERLPWIPWVITAAGRSDSRVRVWSNKRQGSTNHVLWLWEEDYAVILSERSHGYLVVSAYVLMPHRVKSFEREWRQSLQKS